MKRISLQRSITLSILLTGFLSGTLGFSYAYWHAEQSLHAAIGSSFLELARHSSDKMSLVLANEIEWVERLGNLPEVREAVKEGGRFTFDRPTLQQWREEQRYFRSLIIVDRQGRLVGGMTSGNTRAHYLQQPWWTAIMRQKRPWAGDLHVDAEGHGYWELAVPIWGDDGSALGGLKVVVGTDGLFASILRTRIGATGHVMLVAGEGVVLLCPILPAGLHSRIEFLNGNGLHGGSRTEPRWMEVRNDSHGWRGGIVGIAPVLLPPNIVQETVWHVVVRQDGTETHAPAVTLMWKLAAFWIGAVVLIAVIGSRFAGRLARPLEHAVLRIRSLGEGRPAAEAARLPKTAPKELETLEASVTKLAQRLETAAADTHRHMQELKQAGREIAKSEEHYRALWDSASDVKFIVDEEGIVRDANRRTELKLGRDRDALIGTPAGRIFAHADRGCFEGVLQQVFERGEEGFADDLRVETASGATLTVQLDAVPLEKAAGAATVLVQLSDMTEKRELERQLLRSERLASLSQFASMFAHDIRNPLAGMKKTLEWMAQRPELQSDSLGRWFNDLQFTTELLLGMINDMLDVYQDSYAGLPLTTSQFSVPSLLEEVTRLFRSEAEARRISFRVEPFDQEQLLTGDRRRLLRVGINLVHNALKYSPAGGIITLSARLREASGPSGILGARAEPALLLSVEDEGPGIEPDELPHIFDLFFRKKDGRDLRIGRGLGLHFCRLVVEAHHGRMWAANRPSGGAQFCILLPINAERLCPSAL